jgi:hypothetical protein
MDEIINTLLGFVIGVLVTLITIPFTLNENIRDNVNRCITTIGEEISWNRTTVVQYKKHIDELRKSWTSKKNLGNFRTWYYSITVGNNGPIYTTLKFDAFNYYKNSDVPSIVGIAFDYMLTEFYSKCKQFCYNLECIQNRIIEYNAIGKYDLVEKDWENMNIEFNNFDNAFRKYSCCFSPELEKMRYVGIKKINLIDWYIFGKRDIDIIFKDMIESHKEFEKENSR